MIDKNSERLHPACHFNGSTALIKTYGYVIDSIIGSLYLSHLNRIAPCAQYLLFRETML